MKDVFQVVTDRILNQLQKGVIPWRRTWSSNGPTSYQTNKEYQGINALILQDTFKSPYWITFRQCQKLGGSIRAREHGSPIVFVDRLIKEETNGTIEYLYAQPISRKAIVTSKYIANLVLLLIFWIVLFPFWSNSV